MAARSKLEFALDEAIKQVFPTDKIIEEWPIKVGNSTLYCDRVIKSQMLVLEADGAQHGQFNPFMHRDGQGLKNSKARDAAKDNYLKSIGYTVVRFGPKEPINADTLKQKVLDERRKEREGL